MLEICNISKVYHKEGRVIAALDGVSLDVSPGRFVVVSGHSGCGKTTLLLAAGGLLKPDGGRVKIDGKDIYELSQNKRSAVRAETIGFVFQRFHLIPYLNVLDNVLAPSLAVGRSGLRNRAEELIERFGLQERIHHIPAELSTGERQRVALARAMLNSPKIILADEPTGNLDTDNAQVVLKTLADFSAAGGAVLMVTHDKSVEQYAHQTIRLENGKTI